MALPFVLLGLGAASAGWGLKKILDGRKHRQEAKEAATSAAHVYEQAEDVLLRSRTSACVALEQLGRLKLEVWDDELTRFAGLYEQLHPIEMINRIDLDAGRVPVTGAELREIDKLTVLAKQALMGGGVALGAGAVAGVAAYGGAVMFATASTGTAISTLTGVAATNATLAWFGGGAVAAGGAGMAGGVAVLGGIVALPVLGVGGVVWAAMAKEELANARADLAKARVAADKMRHAARVLETIQQVAAQFAAAIVEVRARFRALLDALEVQIRTCGTDYTAYAKDQRELVHLVVLTAQTTKTLLETPFLTPEGGLRDDFEPALEAAQKVVE